MYKPREFESAFIDICNKSKKNIIRGCIYQHPSMDICEFNNYFLNPFMEKITSQDKKLFLMGDVNIDLLKVDMDTPTTNF